VRSPLPSSVLDNEKLYCAIRGAEHWRSELLTGAEIKRLEPEVATFKDQDEVPDNYAPVKVGGRLIAVWCDPTKPELAWIKKPRPLNETRVVESALKKPEDALNLPGLVLEAASSSVRTALSPTAVNSIED
jgi:hypothetical protein